MSTRARWLVAVLVVALVVAALWVPLPSPLTLRDAAARLGPWAPLGFLLLHAVVTSTPVPRTAFTLTGGLLFGPVLGVVLCLVASTVSAAVGFAVARRLGADAAARTRERIGPGRIRALEERLSARGLLTVVSTRLVPAIPFAPLNYAFGLTTVPARPYVLGTLVGLLPGTVAIVLLGDAVTGRPSPTMLVVFLVSGALGVVGLLVSARRRGGPDAA